MRWPCCASTGAANATNNARKVAAAPRTNDLNMNASGNVLARASARHRCDASARCRLQLALPRPRVRRSVLEFLGALCGASQIGRRRRATLDCRNAQWKVAALAVEEPIPQRAPNRAKREILPRNIGFVEQPYVEAFRAWAEVEVAKPCAEHHVDLIDRRQADQRVELV